MLSIASLNKSIGQKLSFNAGKVAALSIILTIASIALSCIFFTGQEHFLPQSIPLECTMSGIALLFAIDAIAYLRRYYIPKPEDKKAMTRSEILLSALPSFSLDLINLIEGYLEPLEYLVTIDNKLDGSKVLLYGILNSLYRQTYIVTGGNAGSSI
jgi:hypothetical protein